MTILSTIQQVCKELSLTPPTQIIGSTDVRVKQLLAFAEVEGKDVRNQWAWPQLNREFTWTLVTDQANYAFNSDYDYQVFSTHFDRSNYWRLVGPTTPSEWQLLKSGISTATARSYFRIKGVADREIFIHPTPSSSQNGNTLVFEYQSLSWVRPKTWTASTAFAAGTYCFYNGNIYSTTVGGVTGSTAPTHTSGTSSDGGVSWAYYSGAYETFLADTDVSLLDENILARGIKWRWRRENKLDYEEFRRDAEAAWKRAATAKKGTRALSLVPQRGFQLLSNANISDGNYGL
jgi:hypothetical protein